MAKYDQANVKYELPNIVVVLAHGQSFIITPLKSSEMAKYYCTINAKTIEQLLPYQIIC